MCLDFNSRSSFYFDKLSSLCSHSSCKWISTAFETGFQYFHIAHSKLPHYALPGALILCPFHTGSLVYSLRVLECSTQHHKCYFPVILKIKMHYTVFCKEGNPNSTWKSTLHKNAYRWSC